MARQPNSRVTRKRWLKINTGIDAWLSFSEQNGAAVAFMHQNREGVGSVWKIVKIETFILNGRFSLLFLTELERETFDSAG